MTTLMMRLAGPMQSWGTDSKFDVRRSGRYPSKSGVIGMLASAAGRSYEDSLDDLRSLRFGVRIDQPGRLSTDYQIAINPKCKLHIYETSRQYIADAVFLAAVEGDAELLSELDSVLKNPSHPLYLGRKSYPVTEPVSLGLREGDLETALRSECWIASDWFVRRYAMGGLDMILDSNSDTSHEIIRDVPVSFNPVHRKHAYRSVSYQRLSTEQFSAVSAVSEPVTYHDPFVSSEVKHVSFKG